MDIIHYFSCNMSTLTNDWKKEILTDCEQGEFLFECRICYLESSFERYKELNERYDILCINKRTF